MEEEVKLEVLPKVDTKEIENAIAVNQKVDEKVVEKSLNYDVLTEEEKNAIDTFIQKIDVKNTAQILQFGASAQNNISKFSDSVLQDVKTKSTGEVGNLLGNLVVEIKDFNSDMPSEKKDGIFGIFNSAKKQLEKIIAKYNKVENNIETYTCIDNLNNTFIIKINSTFEPEIQLDDYTIETDYFKTQYAQASNESKAVTDADKFMKMINSKDYETAYNLLDATYKANTFPTLSSYIQSMEASFYENNFYEMKDISEQGSYYIVTIEIKDRVSASANNKTIKVIIGLKEGTNFAMSFAN